MITRGYFGTPFFRTFENMEPKPKRKRSPAYSVRKGMTGEQDWVNRFKEEFGFDFAKTSRNASKLLDDSGIDFAFVPFNGQLKCGYENARPRFDRIFLEMKETLKKNFPPGDPQQSLPKILIHQIDFLKPEHVGVTMMWKDWKEVYKGYLEWQKAQAQLLIKEVA